MPSMMNLNSSSSPRRTKYRVPAPPALAGNAIPVP
jgi:hypothetical protein